MVGVTDDGISSLSYVTGYNAAANNGVISGTMDSSTATLAKGMCYGSTNTKEHIKLFGIEDSNIENALKLYNAYNNHPDEQSAVDKLLDFKKA